MGLTITKYKPYLTMILFIFVMSGVFYEIYNILDLRNDIIEEYNYNQLNIDFKNNVYIFPLWYQAVLHLINLNLYLFVGGLIYARDRETS